MHTKNPQLDMSTDKETGVLYDADHGTICEYPGDLINWQDDAKLHRAAPDMLEALEKLVSEVEKHPTFYNDLKTKGIMGHSLATAAIEKAKGNWQYEETK
jgi:hypothetical protein